MLRTSRRQVVIFSKNIRGLFDSLLRYVGIYVGARCQLIEFVSLTFGELSRYLQVGVAMDPGPRSVGILSFPRASNKGRLDLDPHHSSNYFCTSAEAAFGKVAPPRPASGCPSWVLGANYIQFLRRASERGRRNFAENLGTRSSNQLLRSIPSTNGHFISRRALGHRLPPSHNCWTFWGRTCHLERRHNQQERESRKVKCFWEVMRVSKCSYPFWELVRSSMVFTSEWNYVIQKTSWLYSLVS